MHKSVGIVALVCTIAGFWVTAEADALVPGAPQNLEVIETGDDYVTVTYTDPIENPELVDEYGFTWIKVKDSKGPQQQKLFKGRRNDACTPVCVDTISPLPACTNIMIAVAASNVDGTYGPAAYVHSATNDSVPLELPSADAQLLGSDVIEVSWKGNAEDECASDVTICWLDEVTEVEHCDDVHLGDGDGSGTYNITGLLPCNHYEITVTPKSPAGSKGKASSTCQDSEDAAPGSVIDLQVTDVGITDVTFTYDQPLENPQCAQHIQEVYIDLLDEHTADIDPSLLGDSVHKDGLLACTPYLIQVHAISRSGLISQPANVTFTTNSTLASIPRNFVAIDIEKDSARLEWFRPTDNYRCVTEYILTIDSAPDGYSVIPEASHIKNFYEAENLSPCTTYDMSLKALTDKGESESAVVSFTTLCS